VNEVRVSSWNTYVVVRNKFAVFRSGWHLQT